MQDCYSESIDKAENDIGKRENAMYKILIVDDEKDVVRLLKDYFQLKGYDTITAYSGVEAMEKVSLKPDVILLDINMNDLYDAYLQTLVWYRKLTLGK